MFLVLNVIGNQLRFTVTYIIVFTQRVIDIHILYNIFTVTVQLTKIKIYIRPTTHMAYNGTPPHARTLRNGITITSDQIATGLGPPFNLTTL